MKRLVFPFLYILISLGIILALRVYLPKYAGMLLFFLLFLLPDGLFWNQVRKSVSRMSSIVRALAAFLFWLPHVLLAVTFTVSLTIPFLTWNIPLRTLLQNTILILFASHFFPLLTYIAWVFVSPSCPIRHLIVKRDPKQGFPSMSAHWLIPGWILGLFTFLLLLAGTFLWQYDFRVRPTQLTLSGLPASFQGLRIVHISDIHLGSWTSKAELGKAVDRINQLRPDMIFFTGDMFNYRTADGEGFQPVLQNLQAPLGIYAIAGNHDYGDYIRWPTEEAKRADMDRFRTFYREMGWILLMNEHVYVKKGTDSLAVIGVENWGATRRFQRLGDLGKALQGVDPDGIQLLLSHDPSYWKYVVRKDYPWIDVTFSGHTHGGQVGIVTGGFRWSPVAWTESFWNGLYTDCLQGYRCSLYVNPGLGTIGYSGRIGIQPEITLFVLEPAPL